VCVKRKSSNFWKIIKPTELIHTNIRFILGMIWEGRFSPLKGMKGNG
jgi:hypothetical protein